MTEKQANKRLKKKHHIYFNNSNQQLITRYAAVIKRSNDAKIKDDFFIEIAYNTGKKVYDPPIINKDNVKDCKNIIDSLYIPNDFRKDIEKGGLEINLIAPEIKYQNKNVLSQKLKSVNQLNYNPYRIRIDKLTGGISVFDEEGTSSSGTIGAFFKTTINNTIYLLSNYHVLLFQSGEIGDKIVHSSKADASSLFKENDSQVIGEIFWKKDIEENKINIIDAAVAKLNKGITVDIGKYTRCKGITMKGIAKPKLGMNVKKCGRSTGLTYGEIRSINCTVNISNTRNKPELYRKQILTTNMSLDGDSGSILINNEGYAVGLLFGGDNYTLSVANNINTVFKHIRKDIPEFKFYKFV
ncbi:hypothetical protein [Winogradskyella sp. 3972H.M.0a.05]|uniref:hypothetical protein n=1 Tax=Winogradskyella sp. 3972H.M.0a.05 TaxID=2950277 RepID=UPI00339152FA